MTPTELRAAAEYVARHQRFVKDCKHIWNCHQFCQWCGSERQHVEAAKLTDHVLSTVREDDGEAITEEWLRSLPHVQGKFPGDIVIGPVVRMIVRNAQSPNNGRWDWCVRSYPIPEEHKPRSRGQLRRLMEGLGVWQ